MSFKDAPKFTGGSIVVNAGYKQSETINQESTDFGTADTQIKGNISVNAYQGAKQDASLTLQNIGISEGEINFGIVAKDADDETAADAVKTGTSTLSAGTVTLGFYSGKPENGNVVSKQVSVKNVEDLTASVTASTGALTLTNVAVDNAGDLTFSATKGKVSVGKHVTFQNTGVVTVEAKEAGQNIDFAADYDGKTGYLNVSGAGAVNVTGNITGDYVKVGDVVKLKDGKPATETEKNTIGIKGDTIAIGTATNETDGVGSLVVGNTLEIAGNFANNTKVEAPATVVTADESANATVTNGTFATYLDYGYKNPA